MGLFPQSLGHLPEQIPACRVNRHSTSVSKSRYLCQRCKCDIASIGLSSTHKDSPIRPFHLRQHHPRKQGRWDKIVQLEVTLDYLIQHSKAPPLLHSHLRLILNHIFSLRITKLILVKFIINIDCVNLFTSKITYNRLFFFMSFDRIKITR